MINKKIMLTAFFFFLSSSFVFSQSADWIETLLSTGRVTYADAALLVLDAAGVNAAPTGADAFRFAAERKWLPTAASADGEARLEGVSLLLMSAFDIPGGLFYTLTKSPHHAYRELVYLNIIQGRNDPAMTVSGGELIFLIGRLLSMQEAEEIALQRREAEQAANEQERLLEDINARLTAEGVAEISARITDQGVTINIPNIQFVANSAELTQEGKNKLEEAARILRNVAERNILVAGHTALAGTPADQLRTSLDRARAAANYLVSIGVRRMEEIVVRGYGAERPLASNATEQGMAQNRRVEIIILTTEAWENLQ